MASSPRITPITSRDGLTDPQRRVFDAVTGSRGQVVGPFTILLYRPEIAAAAESLGGYLRFGMSLDPRLREAVILTVATLLECEFERDAHETLGAQAGLTADQLDSIRRDGGTELTLELGLVTAIARQLVLEHRVADEVFARAKARWSEPELVDLIALIGYYQMLAAVLNAFEVRAPDA